MELIRRRRYIRDMCNAYNLRHRNEAILDIARVMQLVMADLAKFRATGLASSSAT